MSYKIPESVLVVMYTPDLLVLLIERADKAGFWQSVTGSKDSIEEDLRETAQREIFEETGFEIGGPSCGSHSLPTHHLHDWQMKNIYEIYPVWRHRYAPGVTSNTEHVFGLLLPEPINPILSPREHVQYCWLPYAEAADRCFSPSNAEAILQLPVRLEATRELLG